MIKNRGRKIARVAGSLLCALAVALSGIPWTSQVTRVQAADGDVEYTEKEIEAEISTNGDWDAPERIPVNTLCEGIVGGETLYGDEHKTYKITDYEDIYRVEIGNDDFASTKRGRFRVELTVVDGSRESLTMCVEPGDGSGEEFFDRDMSGQVITPSYSYYGPVRISICPVNNDISVKYHLKVVYDTLENDETGKWAETELNTTRGNATALQVNENYWGCLQGSGGDNTLYYKYTLDKPGKVSVSLKPQDGKKQLTKNLWRMYVYYSTEDDYTEYFSGTLASGVQSETYSLGAGTYYIEVFTDTRCSVGQIYSLKVNYEDPTAVSTPKVTDTPVATSMPEATEAPEATETPEATSTPGATSTLEPTQTPEATSTPEATVTPGPTPLPGAMSTPEPTQTPEATKAPVATETPVATSTPIVTIPPEATFTPGATSTPESTQTPEATVTPEATETPGATNTPEPAGTPEPTSTPGATNTPEPTGTPEPTSTPGTASTPGVTGNQNDTDNPVTTPKTTAEENTAVESLIKTITNTKIINVTLKVSSQKTVSVKWKKNKVAQGYKIYRSTKKKKGFKCIKTIKNKNTTSWKDKNVKSGKTYYYKLRAYKNVKKKTYYSKYTKTLMVKVK